MTEKEKMLAGLLYDPSDPELSALLVKARKLARRYNQIDEDESEQRERWDLSASFYKGILPASSLPKKITKPANKKSTFDTIT